MWTPRHGQVSGDSLAVQMLGRIRYMYGHTFTFTSALARVGTYIRTGQMLTC